MENTPTGTQQHAANTQTITPTPTGFYGPFGGAYVPEILYKCVHDLQDAYLPIIRSEEFQREYASLLRDYVGRPSPLYYARRMSEKYGCKLYLKREDLNHTGAHKINNTIGQILLAKKMGKTRIIAETGAGNIKLFFRIIIMVIISQSINHGFSQMVNCREILIVFFIS